jgi:hypothetical protein
MYTICAREPSRVLSMVHLTMYMCRYKMMLSRLMTWCGPKWLEFKIKIGQDHFCLKHVVSCGCLLPLQFSYIFYLHPQPHIEKLSISKKKRVNSSDSNGFRQFTRPNLFFSISVSITERSIFMHFLFKQLFLQNTKLKNIYYK